MKCLGYFLLKKKGRGDNPPIGIILAREKDDFIICPVLLEVVRGQVPGLFTMKRNCGRRWRRFTRRRNSEINRFRSVPSSIQRALRVGESGWISNRSWIVWEHHRQVTLERAYPLFRMNSTVFWAFEIPFYTWEEDGLDIDTWYVIHLRSFCTMRMEGSGGGTKRTSIPKWFPSLVSLRPQENMKRPMVASGRRWMVLWGMNPG